LCWVVDFDVDDDIKKVKDELQNGGTDIIDKIMNMRKLTIVQIVLQDISGHIANSEKLCWSNWML
jgi:hypothetical protein